MLHSKCKKCSMASLVNKSFTGSSVNPEEEYYQCLATVSDECLEGEAMESSLKRTMGVHKIQFFDSHSGVVKQDRVYKLYFKIGFDGQVYYNEDPEVKSGGLSHCVPNYVKAKISSLSKKIAKNNIQWVIVSKGEYWNEPYGWVQNISEASKYRVQKRNMDYELF